jgi:hypothetical protein
MELGTFQQTVESLITRIVVNTIEMSIENGWQKQGL